MPNNPTQPTTEQQILEFLSKESGEEEHLIPLMESIYVNPNRLIDFIITIATKSAEEGYKENLEEFFTEWREWLESERDRARPVGWFKKDWLDGIKFLCDKMIKEMRWRYPEVKALSQKEEQQ